MSGLSLHVGGFGGVSAGPQARSGSSPKPTTATEAAFGPGASTSAPSMADSLNPMQPFGLAFWVGVAAVVGLVIVRQSLPAGREHHR